MLRRTSSGLDFAAARSLLEEHFPIAEEAFLSGTVPETAEEVRPHCDALFRSNTQAFREVLLGCVLARILDRSIDIRQPYAGQGPNAFNGRTLDQDAVNPFLHARRVPATAGPYLSVFRRSVRFDEETRRGVRDKAAYDALLACLSYLESTEDEPALLSFLRYLLYCFVRLREESTIILARPRRLSLAQCERLLGGLLATHSGGLLPVLLVVATCQTLNHVFDLRWQIQWQGINVADAASRVAGDITIARNEEPWLSIEVTERTVDRPRLVATFNNKIAPLAIGDYLFILGSGGATPEARAQAQQYFASDHEVNLVDIKEWILMTLTTAGKAGRASFIREILALLESPGVPQAVRVSWNENVEALFS